ncbi:hypothetical protein [Kordiimonas pumila]|uniref:DUF2007 domain-containing protein n=1 Tax=Kordiimonas pumila TaxID=2161677 RepID=A0ABV7D9F1_9PROT|nr:hypothetical protein [Kordiimonas pumila]
MANFLQVDNRLVTIRTRVDRSNAETIKAVLEAAGIKTFLHSEQGGMGNGRATDVMVQAHNWKASEEALKNITVLPIGIFNKNIDDDGEHIDCGQCGSHFVRPYVGAVPTFIPGIKIAADKEAGWFFCQHCGSHFRNRKSRFAVLPFAFGLGLLAGAFVLCIYWVIEWLKWL